MTNPLVKIAGKALIGTTYVGDKKVAVCPYCDKPLSDKDIYTDIKGWKFCRACLRKGTGLLRLSSEEKKAALEPVNYNQYPYNPAYEDRWLAHDNFMTRPSVALGSVALPAIVGGAANASLDPNDTPRTRLRKALHGAVVGGSVGAGGYVGDTLMRSVLGEYNPTARLLSSVVGGGLGYYLGNSISKDVFGKNRNEKKAAISDVLREAHRQLPNPNIRDWMWGVPLGSLAGYGISRLGDSDKETPAQRQKRRLKAILLGGLAGGAGANLAMDRGRRWLSRLVYPYGYDSNKAIRSPSRKNFYEGAILDKPLTPESEHDSVTPTADHTARTELLRRYLGVHTPNEATDMFIKTKDGRLQYNPKVVTPGSQVEQELLGTKDIKNSDPIFSGFSSLAVTSPDQLETPGSGRYSMYYADSPFSNVFGSHSFEAVPGSTTKLPNNKGYTVDRNLLDAWDFKLDPHEKVEIGRHFKNMLLQPHKALDYLRGPSEIAANPAERSNNVGKRLRSFLLRHGAETFLKSETPLFNQNFRLHYPSSIGRSGAGLTSPINITPINEPVEAYSTVPEIEKQSFSGAMESGADTGQNDIIPPRPVGGDGSTAIGDEPRSLENDFDLDALARAAARTSTDGVELNTSYQDGSKPMEASTLTTTNSDGSVPVQGMVDGSGYSMPTNEQQDMGFNVDTNSSTPAYGQLTHMRM